MTIEELRIILADLLPKAYDLSRAAQNFAGFIEQVNGAISPNNPFSGAINVDQFVAIQTPIYLSLLTAVETAADVLGTDPLH